MAITLHLNEHLCKSLQSFNLLLDVRFRNCLYLLKTSTLQWVPLGYLSLRFRGSWRVNSRVFYLCSWSTDLSVPRSVSLAAIAILLPGSSVLLFAWSAWRKTAWRALIEQLSERQNYLSTECSDDLSLIWKVCRLRSSKTEYFIIVSPLNFRNVKRFTGKP